MTTGTGGRPERDRATVRKAAFASAVGNTIELYDFLIYGTAAAVVFGPLFFPAGDPGVGTLLVFATFGAGFSPGPSARSSSGTSATGRDASGCWSSR